MSRGLRVPTSLRSAATMALERDEEAAAARSKRIDDMAIVRKVSAAHVSGGDCAACNLVSSEDDQRSPMAGRKSIKSAGSLVQAASRPVSSAAC